MILFNKIQDNGQLQIISEKELSKEYIADQVVKNFGNQSVTVKICKQIDLTNPNGSPDVECYFYHIVPRPKIYYC